MPRAGDEKEERVMAKLFFHYGAMNSGKSTALMQVAHNYEERGMRVLVAKPGLDTKGGGKVVSRLGVSRKVDLLISPETDLLAAVRENRRRHGPLSCVLVDEGQFLRREQVDQLMAIWFPAKTNRPLTLRALKSALRPQRQMVFISSMLWASSSSRVLPSKPRAAKSVRRP